MRPIREASQQQFINGTGIQTSTEAINHEKYYLFLMIPAILLIVLLSFTQKRHSFRTDVLHGRPGLVYPMNFLGRSKRFLYGAAFGSIAYLCVQMMFEKKLVVKYSGPNSLKVFIVMFSVLVYGVDFYPLFASLAVDSVLGYVIGSVYSLILTIMFFIQTFSYHEKYSARTLFLTILHSLPLLICLVFTTLAFPVRLFLFVRNKSKSNEKNSKSPLEIIQTSYHGLYVKRILRKPEPSNVAETPDIWQRVLSYRAKLVYTPLPDFRFSTRMVSVMMTGVIILYV
ncbi:hypothetical protein KUTeg_012294 [Tegillarca granosa]|uniref:Receptor for retinol uptake STRA6 n=1 Tax=Tegillarca granosa TaxID=220873 RepID=A0ABQ9EZ40_TEGGR|nr:hypothetical protein KUTeg_012294 [Tegillarca granosa]